AVKRAIVLLALAGCPSEGPPWVQLEPITKPPPAGTAVVRNQEDVDGKEVDIYAITLSAGVALGAQCVDSCSSDYSCAGAKLTAGDPAVLAIYPIYHDGDAGQFAIVASAAGVTTLRVQTACATQSYAVTITAR